MRANGFRLVVLLACTTYHAVLLFLLNSKFQGSECPTRSNNNNVHSSDNLYSTPLLDVAQLNTSIDEYPTHLDKEKSLESSESSIEEPFEQETWSNVSSSAVDRGAWLVFCVIRYLGM
jgi:hypothetical protein